MGISNALTNTLLKVGSKSLNFMRKTLPVGVRGKCANMLHDCLHYFAMNSIRNADNLLIGGTIAGWALSAAAHVLGGINKNKEYSKEQKSFMRKQEGFELASNIFWFLLLTIPCKELAGRLVNTGKLRTETIRKVLGNKSTVESVEEILENKNNPKLLEQFHKFRGSVKALTAAVAGIVVSATVLPLAKTNLASWRQNKEIAKNNGQPKYKPMTTITNNNKPVQPSTTPNLYDGTRDYAFNMLRSGNGGVKI